MTFHRHNRATILHIPITRPSGCCRPSVGPDQFTCVARIYNVYEQRTERTLDDERPNMLAASASASASPVGLNVNNHHIHSLYEQFPASSYHHLDSGGGGGDFDNQNSDAYMTQLQGN